MHSSFPIASYTSVATCPKTKKIQIICNLLHTKMDTSPKKTPKYRKVGKIAKKELLDLVDSGCSIVNAANKLNINYSTAKSIIQNYKKNSSDHKTSVCPTDESGEKGIQKQIQIQGVQIE